MNVLDRQALGGKGETSMSNITADVEKTPAAAVQPETETKPKKPAKGAKTAKKSRKKAKPAKKAPAKSAAERTNKKTEVIAMMKRAKGATLAEIQEATGWQRHTVRGFVSILVPIVGCARVPQKAHRPRARGAIQNRNSAAPESPSVVREFP